MIYRLVLEKFEKGSIPYYAECETDEQDLGVIIDNLANKLKDR